MLKIFFKRTFLDDKLPENHFGQQHQNFFDGSEGFSTDERGQEDPERSRQEVEDEEAQEPGGTATRLI
jgi:hypothetical protein